MKMKCLLPCGPYYNIDGELCGLEEGHSGDCDPTYRPDMPAYLQEEK